MRYPLFSHSLSGSGIALLLTACAAPDLSQQCPISPGATEEQRALELKQCYKVMEHISTIRRDIDVLFMIDNSPSMSPKQKALAENIPRFIRKIDAAGADYHVGVITSDVGALPEGPPPGWANSRCSSVTGDDGRLQALPCTQRTGATSAEFRAACNSLCPDGSFVPQNGDTFISKSNGISNVKSQKDAMGNEIGPQLAFQCLALVGDDGCGVEGQLEASSRALNKLKNPGFLRDNSVLGVVFITDEDDCSVQLAQRGNNNPASMSCNPGSADPASGCYNLDYRCLAKSVECDQGMDTPGAKTHCAERPNNYLEPLTKYSRFFKGLSSDHHLVLAGIWAPSLLDFQAGKSTDGQLVIASENPPGNATNVLNRGRKTDAACFNPDSRLTSDPKGFFGQAQLRLSSFVRQFDRSVDVVEHSICDVNSYESTLDRIADRLLAPDCLSDRPTVVNDVPICLVGYVDASEPSALPDALLPQCSATCCQAWGAAAQPTTKDPGIQAACAAETRDCFCAEPTEVSCGGAAVAGVWRPGNAPVPSGKVVSFHCASTRGPGANTP